jgi:hypothetical protein
MTLSLNFRRLPLVAVVSAVALPTAAPAHDFVTTYPTRAECEVAYVEMNKFDRDWLLATFPDMFASKGEVMEFLTQHVGCEYDPVRGVWFMADHRFDN